MTNTNDVEVLFTGSKIRIGKSKTCGYIYFQPIDNSTPSGVWYRFEPSYYLDYEEFLEDYKNSGIKEHSYAMNKYMREAIWEAYKGIDNKHGGPFGCVIVKDGKIVGRGHNEVLKNKDCTCHGEMMAIRDACANLETFDLSGCELFTTSEPCPMCAGAIQWANINKVYQGCNVRDAESIGFRDKVFYEEEMFNTETLDREECLKLFENYKNSNPQNY